MQQFHRLPRQPGGGDSSASKIIQGCPRPGQAASILYAFSGKVARADLASRPLNAVTNAKGPPPEQGSQVGQQRSGLYGATVAQITVKITVAPTPPGRTV